MRTAPPGQHNAALCQAAHALGQLVGADCDCTPHEWGRLGVLGETETHVEDLLNDNGDGRDDLDRGPRTYLADHGGTTLDNHTQRIMGGRCACYRSLHP